jgi:hypothetical protein
LQALSVASHKNTKMITHVNGTSFCVFCVLALHSHLWVTMCIQSSARVQRTGAALYRLVVASPFCEGDAIERINPAVPTEARRAFDSISFRFSVNGSKAR